MLKPGEYADVLRAIGWRLDQQLGEQPVERIEVAVRGTSIVLSWRCAASDRDEWQRYGSTDLDELRATARQLRTGIAPRPGGEQAEFLRTIGQHLDQHGIVLERLVKVPEGHHLTGTLNRRSFGQWYEEDTIRTMSAERRANRTTPGTAPPGT